MSIKELLFVVKAPEHPLEAGPTENWSSIQKQVGTKLPSDCRDFGLTFGTGKFVEQGIVVFNPFASSFPQWLEEQTLAWRSLKDGEGNEEVPFEVFPKSPGLLPWGTDENGVGMFWLTEGDPNRWPVIMRGENPVYHRFEMDMTTFLAKMFSRAISLPDIWPKSMFKNRSRLVYKPVKIQPRDKSKLANIYELYMKNGMRAGFWIHHEIWEGTGDQFRVNSINGLRDHFLDYHPLMARARF